MSTGYWLIQTHSGRRRDSDVDPPMLFDGPFALVAAVLSGYGIGGPGGGVALRHRLAGIVRYLGGPGRRQRHPRRQFPRPGVADCS